MFNELIEVIKNDISNYKEILEKKFEKTIYIPISITDRNILLYEKNNNAIINCKYKILKQNKDKILIVEKNPKFYFLNEKKEKKYLSKLINEYMNEDINEKIMAKKILQEKIYYTLLKAKVNKKLIESKLLEENKINFSFLNEITANIDSIKNDINRLNEKYNFNKIVNYLLENVTIFDDIPPFFNFLKENKIYLEKYNKNLKFKNVILEAGDVIETSKGIAKIIKILENKIKINYLYPKYINTEKIIAKEIKNIYPKFLSENLITNLYKNNKQISLEETAKVYKKVLRVDEKLKNRNFLKEFKEYAKSDNINKFFNKYKELLFFQPPLFEEITNKLILYSRMGKNLQETKQSFTELKQIAESIYDKNYYKRNAFYNNIKLLKEEEEIKNNENNDNNCNNGNNGNNEKSKDIIKEIESFNKEIIEEDKEEKEKEKIDKNVLFKNSLTDLSNELQKVFNNILTYVPEESETYKYVDNMIKFLEKIEEKKDNLNINPQHLLSIFLILMGNNLNDNVKKLYNSLKEDINIAGGSTANNEVMPVGKIVNTANNEKEDEEILKELAKFYNLSVDELKKIDKNKLILMKRDYFIKNNKK